jgi:hypothetical protein
MSADLSISGDAKTTPPGWLQRLRANLDQHVFFWITLLIALYVFFGVPQITNVWQQQPPLEGGVQTMAGYLVFLSFLIGFYALSMFVVIRRFPARWVQDWVEGFVSRRMERWREQGLGRFYRPSYWFAAVTWRAPDLCCRWLVWSVSNPECRRDIPKVATSMLAAAFVGSTALLFGTRCDASRAYPLAGAFCQNIGLLCLAAMVWLMVAIPPRIGGAERPGKVWLYFGRFLAWLISTALIGELLWLLADTDWRDNVISYRLYTIWAVFQVLTTLVIMGLLIDRWHAATDRWPVRQVAVLVMPILVWLYSRSLPVEASELNRHLKDDQVQVWKTLRLSSDGPNSVAWYARSDRNWFAHLNSRVLSVPDSEPVVIVAASGGGSRAAIFTALVLETLARTPTIQNPTTGESAAITNDPAGDSKPTWADNVVLISSVSGGSLASADHVEHRGPRTPPALVPESPHSRERVLLNTAPVELKHWGLGYAGDLIQTYLDEPPEGFPVEVFRDYYAKNEQDRDDPEVAVAALKAAESTLREQLKEVVTERDKKQAALAPQKGSTPPNAEMLVQEVAKLNDSAASLRTALALLDGYRSLTDPSTACLGRWIWTSRAFDEMCIDFMAPLMRGVLTPRLDRGDALASFWTHRFGWSNCTNFSGYHGPLTGWNYGPDRPAVVFNAVDVARGSRLAIGFPPLPSDLWDAVYQRGVTREPPRALNAPVSLARAVRMSSNFPYGFRAMEFQIPARFPPDPAAGLRLGGGHLQSAFDRVHVLDGGVVDNTGLDTVYELLLAVEYHADPKNHSSYQVDATSLLANLRRHGVCVIEIDAGAKPNTDLPARLNPFGGVTEQNQALENGGYSNADRAKQLYLRAIRRILAQRLEEAGDPLIGGTTSLSDLENGLPPTALHYCFQCNHYKPGHGADPAIMTAWALGPRDKAEVVARFLPELGLWNQRRAQLWDDIRAGKAGVARSQQVARLHILLNRVAALNQVFHRLSLDLADLEKLARAGSPVAPARVAQLRGKFSEAKRQLDPLAVEVGHETDRELREAWTELGRQAREDDERLALLEKARTADQREHLMAELRLKPDLLQQSKESFEQIGNRLEAAEAGVAKKVTAELKHRLLLDPQLKYDQASRQAKEVYEKRAAMKR